MRKKVHFILVLAMFLLLVSPVSMHALTIDNTEENTKVVYRLQNNVISNHLQGSSDYDKDQTCSGGDSLLGDPNDPNSVAWLLQQILDFIKVVGPILVVVLSSVDFAKVIIKSDDEAMAKAQKKLITRLLLAALLFFIPLLVTVLLDLFGLTSESTCGLN